MQISQNMSRDMPSRGTAKRNRILRIGEVVARVGVSKMTLYRWIKAGAFPRQRRLSEYGIAVGWLEEDVEAWRLSRPYAEAA